MSRRVAGARRMGAGAFVAVSGGRVSVRLPELVRRGRFRRNVRRAARFGPVRGPPGPARGQISRSWGQFGRRATLRVGLPGQLVGGADIAHRDVSHITLSAAVGVLVKPSRRVILVMGESVCSGHSEMSVARRSSGKPHQTSKCVANGAASAVGRHPFVRPSGWYTRSGPRMEYLVTLRSIPSARLRPPGGSGVLGWHSAAWSTRVRAQRSITNGWVGHGPSGAGFGGARLETVAREEPT